MINNVVCWLENTAKRFPDKKAIEDKNGSVTFSELREKSRALSDFILNNNIKKSPIVVYMDKSLENIVCFLAIAYSGCFYTPIDISMPQERVQKIIDVLNPSAVITKREYIETVKQYNCKYTVIDYDEAINNMADSRLIEESIKSVIDTDLLYVLFTSGSTGVPKGVSIAHRAVIDYIDCITDVFGINENDSIANQAPFYFDNSILDIYCMIKQGASLYITPTELFMQPKILVDYLIEKKITTIFWVPSALSVISRLRALKNRDLSGYFKRVMFCGEVMSNKHLNYWRRNLPDILYANLYGPTEITDACTYYIADREFEDNEPLPIGKAFRNTEIILLNENNREAEYGEQGEICVRGTSLSAGYYNNKEKTEEAFVQNPLNNSYNEIIYRTGDLGRYNQYGELEYLGRRDFQVKHMGHRIELGEIETAVYSMKEINQCCCLYNEEKQQIVLVIDAEISKADINNFLKDHIPSYMYPNKVIVVEDMPLNANGKIDRKKLGEEYLI